MAYHDIMPKLLTKHSAYIGNIVRSLTLWNAIGPVFIDKICNNGNFQTDLILTVNKKIWNWT